MGVPSFDHTVIEYAGSGAGCTGANYKTALNATENTKITNTTFKSIAGTAVRAFACGASWCNNTFTSVELGPLLCNDVATACP